MTSPSSTGRREYLLGVIDDRVDANGELGQNVNGDLWTSPKRIKQDGVKASVPYSRGDLEAEVNAAIDDGDLLAFAGLVAPVTPDHLRAIIQAERDADITRKVLVGKCNRLLQESKEGGDDAE